MLYRPTSRWTWVAFISLFVEAVTIITLQTVIFAFVYHWIAPEAHLVSSSRVFPAFFSLVTLGFLYKLLILYDTLSQQNTIQVFGLCLYSITLCIYNATQYQQLEGSALVLADNDVIRGDTWLVVRGIVISIIVITTAFTLWMFLLAWELYDEFAWATFRQVEANLEMRRRFLHFQLLISLLKFGGFYSLGFLVQLVIVPTFRFDGQFILSAALIPTSCFLLFASAWVVRHEKRSGTIVIVILQTMLLAFYIWNLTTMYDHRTENDYLPIRRTLTFFATITILVSVLTIGMTWQCYRNFRCGLRPYISGDKKARIMGETFEMELQGLLSGSQHNEQA